MIIKYMKTMLCIVLAFSFVHTIPVNAYSQMDIELENRLDIAEYVIESRFFNPLFRHCEKPRKP